MVHRTQLLRFYDKCETGDRLLAASNGQEQSEQQSILPYDANIRKEKGAPPRTLRENWVMNMRSLDGLQGLVIAPDAILSMPPQSRFDKVTRPRMRTKGGANHPQGLMFRDPISFASGFMSGTLAMLAFAAVLGVLKW